MIGRESARAFLAGGGEMGQRIRDHGWEATPLGPPERWPQGLKTSVRLLLSTGHPMFIWWGPELIQFYNDAYRRSIGPERHPSALGQPGEECWQEIWEIIGPQIARVMEGEGHTWHENQLVPITRHGQREDVYWTYSYGPIDEPTAANGIGGVLVVCTETTDQVLVERTLREQDRRKDEFMAMLAHELRNPLAPIRSAGELLTRTAGADHGMRQLGELVGRQVDQLTRIVDDLLDMSRISQGRIELDCEPVELGVAIEMAIESVKPLLGERELAYDGSGAPAWIEGDRPRIVQALSNILSNAAKFTDRDGRIEIALRREDGTAIVEIGDDGVGIDGEMLSQVFELFVQGDHSLDRSQGGLGIGLSLVRRLIEQHGGGIVAESPGPGEGAMFRIRLPLVEPPGVSAAMDAAATATPRRILVVDDKADAADSLAELLAFEGHDTVSVYGAREALERSTALDPDVVLLDIGLPDMDGYEVARRLRRSGSAALLVAVTGYGHDEDVRRAHDAGFDAHLTKPVSFAELTRLLDENPRARS